MTESDNASVDTPEVPEDSENFNREHYDRLMASAEKDDGMKDWNEWVADADDLDGRNMIPVKLRGGNLGKALLKGVDLRNADLRKANLSEANLCNAMLLGADLQGSDLRGTNLQNANLGNAKLQYAMLGGSDLRGACLSGADLSEADISSADLRTTSFHSANLQDANLDNANLQEANLHRANLQGARLEDANLKGACLQNSNLTRARLARANLQEAHLLWTCFRGANLRLAQLQRSRADQAEFEEADLYNANLQGVRFRNAHLRGSNLAYADLRAASFEDADIRAADFSHVIIDGETNIDTDWIDRETNFSGVGLGAARIRAGLRQVLEYNVRKARWKTWYKKHPIAAVVVWAFWWVSDYGFSMGRILAAIGGLSAVYASVYWVCPHFLHVDNGAAIQDYWHALYFSVVTTTTLGFGDISANHLSTIGQFVLMSQVLLGYILLGALITRLAVLFSSDGPSLGFYKEKTFFRRVVGVLKSAFGWMRRRLHT